MVDGGNIDFVVIFFNLIGLPFLLFVFVDLITVTLYVYFGMKDLN